MSYVLTKSFDTGAMTASLLFHVATQPNGPYAVAVGTNFIYRIRKDGTEAVPITQGFDFSILGPSSTYDYNYISHYVGGVAFNSSGSQCYVGVSTPSSNNDGDSMSSREAFIATINCSGDSWAVSSLFRLTRNSTTDPGVIYNEVMGIAVHPTSGNLYVTSNANYTGIFTPGGVYVADYAGGQPFCISPDGTRFFCTDGIHDAAGALTHAVDTVTPQQRVWYDATYDALNDKYWILGAFAEQTDSIYAVSSNLTVLATYSFPLVAERTYTFGTGSIGVNGTYRPLGVYASSGWPVYKNANDFYLYFSIDSGAPFIGWVIAEGYNFSTAMYYTSGNALGTWYDSNNAVLGPMVTSENGGDYPHMTSLAVDGASGKVFLILSYPDDRWTTMLAEARSPFGGPLVTAYTITTLDDGTGGGGTAANAPVILAATPIGAMGQRFILYYNHADSNCYVLTGKELATGVSPGTLIGAGTSSGGMILTPHGDLIAKLVQADGSITTYTSAKCGIAGSWVQA
jgi:hypothetical protein